MLIAQANVEQGTKYFVLCVETLHGEPKVLNTKVKTKSRPQTIYNIGSENYSGKNQ